MTKWGMGFVLVAAIAVYGCTTATNGGPIGMGGEGGDAGMGGSAGEGGSGGAAGEGGSGGAAGEGGQGGVGGGAGQGGDGGQGGAGGIPDPCGGGLGPCDPTGTESCVDNGGVAQCNCVTGYTGMLCDGCDAGYVDNPMNPGECILDPCAGDPCGIGSGAASACDVVGPGEYSCVCSDPFEGVDCQCDTSIGEYPEGAGCWICTGTPTPGVFVDFRAATPPVTQIVDLADGYSVTPGAAEITFNTNGLGANLVSPDYRLDAGESLLFEFFESDGGAFIGASTVSSLELYFERFDFIDVRLTAYDRTGAEIGSTSNTMGTGWLNINDQFGGARIHSVLVEPQGATVIGLMRYDHDCL